MKYDDLLNLLEIENSEEFGFFEHFATIMEYEGEIGDEELYRLLSETDKKNLSEIVKNYFEEIEKGIPDDCVEVYTLLKSISMYLRGLLKQAETADTSDSSAMREFAEGLCNFRNWYIRDSRIQCIDKATGTMITETFFEAMLLSRLEQFGGKEYQYDFDNNLDYEIDEYVVSFSDMVDDEEDGYFEEDLSEEDYEYHRGLFEEEF